MEENKKQKNFKQKKRNSRLFKQYLKQQLPKRPK